MTVLTDSPLELVLVEVLVSVVVHTTEDDSDSSDSVGSATEQLFLDFGEDRVWLDFLHEVILRFKHAGKFFVV